MATVALAMPRTQGRDEMYSFTSLFEFTVFTSALDESAVAVEVKPEAIDAWSDFDREAEGVCCNTRDAAGVNAPSGKACSTSRNANCNSAVLPAAFAIWIALQVYHVNMTSSNMVRTNTNTQNTEAARGTRLASQHEPHLVLSQTPMVNQLRQNRQLCI